MVSLLALASKPLYDREMLELRSENESLKLKLFWKDYNVHKLHKAMLDQGVYLAPSGYEVGFLSTAHDDAAFADFSRAVDAVAPILDALATAGWPLFLAPETRSYRVGANSITVRQFLVQDPDGYLLRFSQALEDFPDAA